MKTVKESTRAMLALEKLASAAERIAAAVESDKADRTRVLGLIEPKLVKALAVL